MFLKSINILKIAILFIGLCLLLCTRTVDSYPYQELEPRKGYVPVYIRIGDTPLSEINPKLAEAFPESESDNLKLENASTTAGPESAKTESDIASFETVKGDNK